MEQKSYLNESEAAAALGVGRRTLQRWRHTGDGPAFVRAGPRRVIYSAEAIREWAGNRTFAHRAAEMSAALTS